MATLAELLIGADAEGYEPWCDDLQNNFKNHWRRAAVRTTLTLAQAGMIGDDSADNTLWHCVAPGAPPTWHQIVQTTVPVLDDLNVYFGTNSDGSVKYDEATNDAIIVGVPVTPKRGIIYCRTADIAQNFTALIGASTEVQKHIIDVDRDSTFDYGFFGDDIGLLTVPANPLRENMLTNPGFGVWSNSDTNKGLGSMGYDSGSVAPVVGETMTGATSGAVGKIISYTVIGGTWGGGNAAGIITLGVCDGRFNDNEDVNGSVGGANMLTVNMPDTAAGVDLVRNGEFQGGVGGWTPVDCTLASIAGGQVGNCLELTRTGGATQRFQEALALTVGKIYKLIGYVKSGTSGNEPYEITVTGMVSILGISSGAWVGFTATFEAISTSPNLALWKNSATAGTMLFDEVSCYEITPCCTAADALAFDTWVKESSSAIDIYRQHWDATYAKDGSFYSLKMVQTGAVIDGYVRFPGAFYDKGEWYAQFQGRTVAFGVWIYASKANHCRVGVIDSVGSDYSVYHSGTPGWEWLEIARIVNAAAASFQVRITSEGSAEVNGTSIIYASQPMLVFGSSIGIGNFRPRQQERILLEKKIPSNLLHSKTNLGDVAVTDLNVEADSSGMLPKGCKAVKMLTQCNDVASAGTGCYLRFRANAAKDYEYYNSPYGRANDTIERVSDWQQCDENGDIDYNLEASGVGTFDVPEMVYCAVQIS